MVVDMRRKPKDYDIYDWNAFEKWADEASIGKRTDDWLPWWECWVVAYNSAHDNIGNP